ncbi:MAG TPA: class I SAM-dependent methyltransferase [Longimicrobiaceae bacterium]|nr:class I SAM-dependent methyltransferase [Longimicrobiaceae bacterium]
MDDPKRIVEQGYDRIAERHAEWAGRTRAEERERYARLLFEVLPASARVLELGCGVGVPTTRRLAERFRVTAVDLSARHVALARENVPGAEVVQGDMARLELPPASFDAVAAFYSIIHVPRDEHAELFRRIAGWLGPGGVMLAALGTRDVSAGYEADWLGAPMYWSSHEPRVELRNIEAAGLAVERAEIETAEEDGQPVSFLWVLARR